MKEWAGNRLATRMAFPHFRSAGMAGLVAAMLILNACSSSLYGGWLVRTNSTPLAPGLDPDDLQERPVAVFSALGPPAFRGNEVALTYYLDDVLHKVGPDWKIIPSQETATRINRQGLAAEYSRMRSDYELTASSIVILSEKSLPPLVQDMCSNLAWQISSK